MSESMRIAVPVESGEGLGAVRSEHFGHSAAFALIDVVDGVAGEVRMLVNPPHEHGGCMVTVNVLAREGVQAVSAAGMGRGPLNGLLASGITVHHDTSSRTVAEAVAAIVAGRTGRFDEQHACGGHGGHAH